MKYFINNTPARDIVRRFSEDYSDMNSYELADIIYSLYEENWMIDKTPSLKGNDTILSHMIRTIRAT
tara:strand:+ start:568 stop:768 length:201 start_codon:yes stop_codon:yes gene_type:complete